MGITSAVVLRLCFRSVRSWGGSTVLSIYTKLKKARDGYAAVVSSLGVIVEVETHLSRFYVAAHA